jgi:small subunit ribosomal protein S4e
MATKGEQKTQKRISSPVIRPLKKKQAKWTIKTRPGPHNKQTSVPIGIILRETLKITKNTKETKKILNQKTIKINEKPIKNPRFPLGIFDYLEITIQNQTNTYRAILDHKKRIKLVKTNKKYILGKIETKKTLPKNKTQYRLNNGMTLVDNKINANPGDTLIIDPKTKKITKHLPAQKEATAYITGGTHVSQTVKIKEITPATQHRKKTMTIETKKGTYQTTANHITIIGENKPEPGILGDETQ